jgi:oligosaccharide repeat unit polymerase
MRNPHTEYLFGRSYVDGLTIPIPRLIWPEKPVSVTYQFRDEYFPAERERGTIAGTGFSSILEAYMNFGVAGIVAVYLLLGYCFGAFDGIAGRSLYWLPRLAQALSMPFAFTLPRSSFDAPYFVPLIGISAISLALLFVRNAGQKV